MKLTAKQTRMQEQILKKLYGVEVFEDGKYWYLTNQGTITLPRVLHALGEKKYAYFYGSIIARNSDIGWCEPELEMKRKLLNKDMTDATLFDQSEETQDAIATLLGRKD